MQNCYNTDPGGRIPREAMHDQKERLTTKHINTLQFLQEIANENKELKKRVEELEAQQQQCAEIHAFAENSKERIKQIQEQYLKRADEINAMMAEKHRNEMMQLVEEKLDQEKRFTEEIAELKAEQERLEKSNRELRLQLGAVNDSEDQVKQLQHQVSESESKLNKMKMEIETLKAENKRLIEDKSSQLSCAERLQNLRTQNEALSHELKETNQKNMELNYRVSKLERDLQEASADRDQAGLVESLTNKLTKLHKERIAAEEREKQYDRLVGDLKAEVDKLRNALGASEMSRRNITEEYQKALAELQTLRKRLSLETGKKTFKEFVELKRELNFVKDENSDLRHLVKGTPHGSFSLPCLKDESLPLVRKTSAKNSKSDKKQTGK